MKARLLFSRIRFLVASLVLVLLPTGCMGSRGYSIRIPVIPTMAMSENPFLGRGPLPSEFDRQDVASLITSALQSMEYSIDPNVFTSSFQVVSDLTRFSPKELDEYNKSVIGDGNRHLQLPTDLKVYVKYKVTFRVATRELSLNSRAFVYTKGRSVSSQMEPYRGDYSSTYFGQRLEAAIERQIQLSRRSG